MRPYMVYRSMSSHSLVSRMAGGPGPDHAVLLQQDQALLGGQGHTLHQATQYQSCNTQPPQREAYGLVRKPYAPPPTAHPEKKISFRNNKLLFTLPFPSFVLFRLLPFTWYPFYIPRINVVSPRLMGGTPPRQIL
jgi:hypothetical protein